MSDKPLSVGVAMIVDNGDILLLQRERGAYVGLWSLPGGKVEQDEHLREAVVREVKEEAGIETRFVAHTGIVSEHLVVDGGVDQHFLLHCCRLEPRSRDVAGGAEGAVDWVPLSDIDGLGAVLPSDRAIIEHFVEDRKSGYVECVMEQDAEEHTLRRFTPVDDR